MRRQPSPSARPRRSHRRPNPSPHRAGLRDLPLVRRLLLLMLLRMLLLMLLLMPLPLLRPLPPRRLLRRAPPNPSLWIRTPIHHPRPHLRLGLDPMPINRPRLLRTVPQSMDRPPTHRSQLPRPSRPSMQSRPSRPRHQLFQTPLPRSRLRCVPRPLACPLA